MIPLDYIYMVKTLSLDMSQVAHQARAYPASFCSMEELGVGWDATVSSPLHGYISRIKFDGTHLNTWVERGTVRVKCSAHEQ